MKAWFDEDERPVIRFYIPVVRAIGRRTDLMGTRHRLAALLPHMEELPVAIAQPIMSKEAREYLDSNPKRRLDINEPFWTPDFPVHDELPWPPK